MKDWLNCVSLTDDGYVLGNHICSHMQFMMHDLYDRSDRLKKIKSHFKDEPYQVEMLSYEECKTHQGFLAAAKIAKDRMRKKKA